MNQKEMLREYEDKEIKIDSDSDSEVIEEILSGLTIGKFPHELRMEAEHNGGVP